MEEKLQDLRFKRAALFCKIESQPKVSKSLFSKFGKVCAEIILLEKKIVRETAEIG
jgi:hypothetical protein